MNRTPSPVTPEQIRLARKALGRTQQQMADLFRVTRVTWARWELGVAVPQPGQHQRLAALIPFAAKAGVKPPPEKD